MRFSATVTSAATEPEHRRAAEAADAGTAALFAAGAGRPDAAPGVAGYGMLGLFLLLCGVFAALTAQGRPDVGRAVLAVESVRAAFDAPAGRPALGSEGRGGPADAEGPLGHFATAAGEGVVRVDMDIDRLFDAAGRMARARLFLLARLAAATRAGWEVHVLTPPGPGADGRLAKVVRLLDGHGALPARLVFGVDPTLQDVLRFEAVPPGGAG